MKQQTLLESFRLEGIARILERRIEMLAAHSENNNALKALLLIMRGMERDLEAQENAGVLMNPDHLRDLATITILGNVDDILQSRIKL